MAYATTAELKTYLDISGAGDDTLLGDLIDRAKGIIDRYTGRTFEASANTSRTFDSQRDVDGLTLYIDHDLASINAITNGDGVAVASNEYTTEPRNRTPYYAIKILPSSGKAWEPSSTTGDHEDAITISGKWAWSETAPDDIAHVCIRLAGYLYRQRDNAGDLDRPVYVSNATILPATIPQDIRLALDPYRLQGPSYA